MTDALEGRRAKGPTLREQANWPRIGRARFIGNVVGIALLVLLVEVALTFAGFKDTIRAPQGELSLPNRWVVLAGSLVLFVCQLDLAVRRRHDRGKSGVDVAVVLILLEALGVAAIFGLLVAIPTVATAAVSAVAGVYLLVVLAILPGDKGPNRYGPDPRLP